MEHAGNPGHALHARRRALRSIVWQLVRVGWWGPAYVVRERIRAIGGTRLMAEFIRTLHVSVCQRVKVTGCRRDEVTSESVVERRKVQIHDGSCMP
jgi:hypothetical protein